MAKSSPRGSLTGIAAVALVAIGVFVGSKIQSPGPGGPSDVEGTQTSVVVPVSTEPVEAVDLPEQDEPTLEPLGAPPMITVLIRDDGFFVTRGDAKAAGSLAMALPELADLAATTSGTADGIRVRVERHTSARAGDQQRLYQALTGVGIKPEALQQISEFVE